MRNDFYFLLLLFIGSVGLIPISFAATVDDANYTIEEYVTGLSSPTTMTFVGDDILVLQKNDGKVRLVHDGILQNDPVLDLPVSNNSERGLLGIESVGNDIYLFYTESDVDGGEPLGNRVYKYHWNGTILQNPTLLEDLPVTPGSNHNGGVLAKNSDGDIFTIIGDLNRNGILQNYSTGDPDNTSVILPVDPSGSILAMGIRNSFGLGFDSLTGKMWDTENGPASYDEINLVTPNFNSGWETIMGPATQDEIDSLPGFEDFVYSDPEFSWEDTIAPTALIFTNSTLFADYSDSLFVGACNNGIIYKFDLNQNRDGFVFSNPELSDLVLDIGDDPTEIQWGSGFGCITDMEMGPDNYLYLVSVSSGKIYRILPSNACNLPVLGTWTISESCRLYSDFVSPQGILVENNSVLTIPDGITLTVPSGQNLIIEFGSGVLIKNGGGLMVK